MLVNLFFRIHASRARVHARTYISMDIAKNYAFMKDLNVLAYSKFS